VLDLVIKGVWQPQPEVFMLLTLTPSQILNTQWVLCLWQQRRKMT